MQRSTPSSRQLSELECFIIGLIWRYGPSTPYAVRQRLQGSPSTQWSGSAGTVYPLVTRLERAGLLKSRSAKRGKRASREYEVTAAGRAALREWLGPPLPAEAMTVSHDPLRSRARFLAVLPEAQRREWVEAALASLEEVTRLVREWDELHAEDPDPFQRLMTRSGVLDIRARKAWLREALKALGG